MLNTNAIRLSRDTYKVLDQLKAESRHIEATLSQQLTKYTTSKIQNSELMEYLEFLDGGLDWHGAFTVPGAEDGYNVVNEHGNIVDKYYLLNRWRQNLDAGVFNYNINARTYPIWAMSEEQRYAENFRWLLDIIKDQADYLSELAANYNESQKKIQKIHRQKDASAMKEKRVIGCTTSGAATRFEEIQAANVDVLLVVRVCAVSSLMMLIIE
jgi:hypothetical protein